MITLPYTLGGQVRDALDMYRKKYNMPEPEEVKNLSVHRRRDTFLESELELIKEIHINDQNVEYIDYFPNITSLHFDLSSKLDQLTIQQIINKYPNLTDLSIIGQPKVQYVDVSNLKKLQELTVMNNKSLHRIGGLENLEDMYDFTFYNNEAFIAKDEVCNAALNLANDGCEVELDVLYYPNMMEITKTDKELEKQFNQQLNFKWGEAVGLGKLDSHLQYSTNEIDLAYKKALSVVENYIQPTDTAEQKYAILYQWMCENVRYDFNSLDIEDRVLVVNGMQQGKKGGTNGTVNSLVYGNCICQGYSKGLQMLMKLAGLPAFDVECIVQDLNRSDKALSLEGKRNANIGDHSIQKVNLDGKTYYSDVTWDAGRTQEGELAKYFLLSKTDIQVDHKLVGEEGVIYTAKSKSPEEQQQLLSFASNRMKQVNEKIRREKEIHELKLLQEKYQKMNQQESEVANKSL